MYFNYRQIDNIWSETFATGINELFVKLLLSMAPFCLLRDTRSFRLCTFPGNRIDSYFPIKKREYFSSRHDFKHTLNSDCQR